MQNLGNGAKSALAVGLSAESANMAITRGTISYVPTVRKTTGRQKEMKQQQAKDNHFLQALTGQQINGLNSVDSRERLIMMKAAYDQRVQQEQLRLQNMQAAGVEMTEEDLKKADPIGASDPLSQANLSATLDSIALLTPEQQQKHLQFLKNQQYLKQVREIL